jgi:hypothetical protein
VTRWFRSGLRAHTESGKAVFFVAGALVLFVYGYFVNAPS